ncbi:conserved protein of unknown function [Denitratisoma oestradiolicum]|uniref:Uncharacterized protein n=2 Tax=Denitratisoma oestradiolicum TaxID=311182 RepID=A0A6S6XVM7_9PROT|nr:conserved protein of unknown function [Denitratisoma oestradiolicum]
MQAVIKAICLGMTNPTIIQPMTTNDPVNPTPRDPRSRLKELLAIHEYDRTDAQWDEIVELEIQLAPGNRIGAPPIHQSPKPRHMPGQNRGGGQGQGGHGGGGYGGPGPHGGGPGNPQNKPRKSKGPFKPKKKLPGQGGGQGGPGAGGAPGKEPPRDPS